MLNRTRRSMMQVFLIHSCLLWMNIVSSLSSYNNSNVSNLSKYGKYKMMKWRVKAKPLNEPNQPHEIYSFDCRTLHLWTLCDFFYMHISVAQASFGWWNCETTKHSSACRNGTSLLCVYNIWLKFEDENPCPLGILYARTRFCMTICFCLHVKGNSAHVNAACRNLCEL